MQQHVSPGNEQRLGRLCDRSERGSVTLAAPLPGLERIDARFFGDAFVPHRHDTYAIGVTMAGVQRFWYRGEEHFSTNGQVIVLHPDELHDGGAGTQECLRYRMLYLEPEVLRSNGGLNGAALPFLKEPVISDPTLRQHLFDILGDLTAIQEELFIDEFLANLAERLIATLVETFPAECVRLFTMPIEPENI